MSEKICIYICTCLCVCVCMILDLIAKRIIETQLLMKFHPDFFLASRYSEPTLFVENYHND